MTRSGVEVWSASNVSFVLEYMYLVTFHHWGYRYRWLCKDSPPCPPLLLRSPLCLPCAVRCGALRCGVCAWPAILPVPCACVDEGCCCCRCLSERGSERAAVYCVWLILVLCGFRRWLPARAARVTQGRPVFSRWHSHSAVPPQNARRSAPLLSRLADLGAGRGIAVVALLTRSQRRAHSIIGDLESRWQRGEDALWTRREMSDGQGRLLHVA